MGPCVSAISAIAGSIDGRSATSSRATEQPAAARCAKASGRRAVATTFQPALAKRSAVASPIPEEEPVIRTVLETSATLALPGALHYTPLAASPACARPAAPILFRNGVHRWAPRMS